MSVSGHEPAAVGTEAAAHIRTEEVVAVGMREPVLLIRARDAQFFLAELVARVQAVGGTGEAAFTKERRGGRNSSIRKRKPTVARNAKRKPGLPDEVRIRLRLRLPGDCFDIRTAKPDVNGFVGIFPSQFQNYVLHRPSAVIQMPTLHWSLASRNSFSRPKITLTCSRFIPTWI